MNTRRSPLLVLGLALIAVWLMALCSCVKEEVPTSDTPEGNFEALWRLMDSRYCFFDYKKETLGVDWDEVHERYRQRITPYMSRLQQFEVLSEMLGELRDGHVNLGASFDLGRSWHYREDYPDNFRADIVEEYLGKGDDYNIASALRYRIFDDNIGYIRCESFSDPLGDGNITAALSLLATCNGLIIDVRDNGGGALTIAELLASHFTNKRTLVGYTMHKTGKGHGAFSAPQPIYIKPASSVRWQKPVVVLTNRGCYSATNCFASYMKRFDQVTLLGDSTGGGGGMPFTQDLPSGWTVRYSAVVTLDAEHQQIEFGVSPDIFVSLSDADAQDKRDTLIEAARQLLRSKASAVD